MTKAIFVGRDQMDATAPVVQRLDKLANPSLGLKRLLLVAAFEQADARKRVPEISKCERHLMRRSDSFK